jgi:hypothetical protein
MILETIMIWVGFVVIFVSCLAILAYLFHAIVDLWLFKPMFLRLLYLYLFLRDNDSQGINKVFKDNNNKKYIITVKEVRE